MIVAESLYRIGRSTNSISEDEHIEVITGNKEVRLLGRKILSMKVIKRKYFEKIKSKVIMTFYLFYEEIRLEE